MSRILILAAAATLGAAVALSAAAHPGHPGHGGPGGGAMMMMLHEHLEALDANKDGFITRDEFLAHPSQMFDKLDANHDGRVSKDELAAMSAMHGGEHRICKIQKPGESEPKEVPCDSVEGMHGMHGGPGGDHMLMMHHMAQMMDTDHDGRVSFAEMEATMREHFKKLDKNGDGYVSKDEAPGEGMIIEKHVETHD
jgi:Ca2+-binding EF-hand superfamily protein